MSLLIREIYNDIIPVLSYYTYVYIKHVVFRNFSYAFILLWNIIWKWTFRGVAVVTLITA